MRRTSERTARRTSKWSKRVLARASETTPKRALPRASEMAWILLLCTLVAACGSSFWRRDRGALRDDELGPLVDLVPPGPAWLIQARPRALAEQEAARALWRSVVSEQSEQKFAERTGVDPLQVDELVAFELPPNGYVLLVRGPFDARTVVRRAGERLAVRDVDVDKPVVRREGPAGQGRYAYAALAEHTLSVAKDAPPELVAAMLKRRSDRKTAGVLDEPDARSLYAEHAATPFAVFAPTPLKFEPGTDVSILFARERALAVTVVPTHSVLPISIDLRGEFPPGAEHNLRALAKSLASAELGRAFGLSRVPDTMAIRVDAQGALVTFALDARELIAGVRMMFFDDMRQIFGG